MVALPNTKSPEINDHPETVSSSSIENLGVENNIYTRRFSTQEELVRSETWEVLVSEFLQSYIRADSTVLDLGSGDGLFIKNINASKKIAVDLSPHVQALSRHGIKVLQVPATEMAQHVREKVDVVFMSNFLEHMPNKKVVIEVLEQARQVLGPEGRVIILQPNIRYVGAAYWDYIDHHVALTEHSLVELLDITGFNVEKLIARFLPYTAKSSVGRVTSLLGAGRLVRAYLKLPLLWRIFGQQTFIVGKVRDI